MGIFLCKTCYAMTEKLIFEIFRAIYHLTMLAVPHLIKTKGSIVNVSSVNGVRSVSPLP